MGQDLKIPAVLIRKQRVTYDELMNECTYTQLTVLMDKRLIKYIFDEKMYVLTQEGKERVNHSGPETFHRKEYH